MDEATFNEIIKEIHEMVGGVAPFIHFEWREISESIRKDSDSRNRVIARAGSQYTTPGGNKDAEACRVHGDNSCYGQQNPPFCGTANLNTLTGCVTNSDVEACDGGTLYHTCNGSLGYYTCHGGGARSASTSNPPKKAKEINRENIERLLHNPENLFEHIDRLKSIRTQRRKAANIFFNGENIANETTSIESVLIPRAGSCSTGDGCTSPGKPCNP